MKKELSYDDWFMIACTAWIDWENDPPPAKFITEDLCLASMQNTPHHLGKIPVEFRTAEVCYAAVYQDDDLLEFVPEHLREDVWAQKDAISEKEWLDTLSWYKWNDLSSYEGIVRKLTKKLLTPEFCLALVKLNGLALELVPEELRTPEIKAAAEWETKNGVTARMRKGG